MRYLKKYENHEDIHQRCREYGILNYTINSDGSIDVNGSVDLRWSDVHLASIELTKLSLNFRNVIGGHFYCDCNRLTSLEGCPKSVDNFSCSSNNLTNLKGCPKLVGGYFACFNNNLTNLKGCPKSVGGYFGCSSNNLTNLKGCPKSVGGNFWCDDNKIDTFEGLDFIHIGGDFHCSGNPIFNIWRLFEDHTKFEFFNDCDPIREDRVIILDRLNFFLDYIDKPTVKRVEGYKCI